MKLLPLGTVITVKERKVSIIGYGSVDKEETATDGYFVVPYPIGFTSIEKVFFIPRSAEVNVIAEGYKTAFSEQVLDMIAQCFDMVKKMPYEDLLKINDAFGKVSLKQKEAENK